MSGKIGYVLLVAAALVAVTCIGAAYAYQATYTEDPTQSAEVTPTYITISKASGQEMPATVNFAFSTINQTAGENDITVDADQPITVKASDDSDPIAYEYGSGTWTAEDQDKKRLYTLDLSSGTEAEAVFLLGTYTVTHNGSDAQITVTPSKAAGEDTGDIVALMVSETEDYGGAANVTVASGSTVYLYAHVDVSDAFSTESYGTVSIPEVTPSLTAVPAE
ncbi:MAG: hypothetical protein II933_03200 [Candidatus Methanomethylophilaceae archaeon]|nr:hypothetical protein [Candidatus Methanomethylophilaceae archaeon]